MRGQEYLFILLKSKEVEKRDVITELKARLPAASGPVRCSLHERSDARGPQSRPRD